MTHFILASHGHFSQGIYESIKIIIGEQPNVHIVCGYVDDRDVKQMISDIMGAIPEKDEIIAVTDIFGGSINNEMMNYRLRKGFYLISGMNLPLLTELFLSSENDITKRIENAVELASENIIFCNKKAEEGVPEEDF